MKTVRAVGLIAVMCDDGGPTGTCREVLEVDIVDYGGNVWGHATTPRGVRRVIRGLRIATRLQPTKLGGVVPCDACCDGYTVDCGFVHEGEGL